MKPTVSLSGLACALLLSACAADDPLLRPDKSASPSLDGVLAEANRASAAGQQDKALALLRAAAGSHPAEKGPWLAMAQMKFDRASYGEAILNAQEALQRDPDDKIGHSIIAISGLRLSTKSVAELNRYDKLTVSLRDEAQGLARTLRTSLGEEVLVPPSSAATTTVAPKRAVQPVRRVPPGARPAVPSGADPFSSLK